MKAAGTGAVLLAAFFFALETMGEKKRRIAILQELCRALEQLKAELSVHLTPMPELLSSLAEKTRGSVSLFFRAVLDAMPGLGERAFYEIWSAAASAQMKELTEPELVELMKLGEILGRYELGEQLLAVEDCLGELRSALEAHCGAYPNERRLIFGLSLAGGFFLTIVLL